MLELDIEKMDMLINGDPIVGGTPSFSGVTQSDGGFIRNVSEFSFISPLAPPDSVITMITEFNVELISQPGVTATINEVSFNPDAPNGFENIAPFAKGMVSYEGDGVSGAVLDFMHQISAIGVEQGSFNQVAMENHGVQVEMLGTDRYRVTSEWTAIEPGETPMIGFDVQNDFRGFARPEPIGFPSDCNGDGELTILDFICFQNLFQEGCF